MLFDFVRAAFASPGTASPDLSRRLRDGVSLYAPQPSSRVSQKLMQSLCRDSVAVFGFTTT
jgi:hypothetical protein